MSVTRTIVFSMYAGMLIPSSPGESADTIRIATFNVALHGERAGEMARKLTAPGHVRAEKVAHIIRAVRPDILLLNEFDYDAGGRVLDGFRRHYLEAPDGGPPPITYPHAFTAAVNTGVPSGFDLNGDGRRGEGAKDAFGYGLYPGQYGMALLSRFPIEREHVRTFRRFRWADMPGALGPAALPEQAASRFRLSSKSHWDVPVRIGGATAHLLCAHPVPPVFDGPEDFNGRRNHDEIRFWADYIGPARSAYIRDDAGVRGGLPEDARFVILGDYNADPDHGQSRPGAIEQLLEHPRISTGKQPADKTAAWGLRVDYVLPSKTGWRVKAGRVFRPSNGEEGRAWITGPHASDHYLVWIDLELKPIAPPSSRSSGRRGGVDRAGRSGADRAR
ncbi:endonuclease/exonuclease/phosphatase family protein [Kiritimatiella glycovorans]|uniref:Putative endonuclease/exonuclease/phosphatase n=1 Tax=Kiritimatiella glycovorans TaxID=1307763 RepID=A0A0G3EH45_9BACT|nr:endonuclease/exonuclease/phosphatase family protein [Kiritimatiella glycovorans]AKJ64742.1 putative endonuclease/exonuclease/phosphatase [Kiritimatiella glycovorans]